MLHGSNVGLAQELDAPFQLIIHGRK